MEFIKNKNTDSSSLKFHQITTQAATESNEIRIMKVRRDTKFNQVRKGSDDRVQHASKHATYLPSLLKEKEMMVLDLYFFSKY